MGGVSPDAWSSEGPAPAAIAPEPTERPSERLAALRASSALHEFVDPGVAGLADVRAFRFLEDRPEFRRRREVSERLDGRELAGPSSGQGDAHDRGRNGEAERDRGGVGLPRDVPDGRETQEQLEEQESDDDVDNGHCGHPRQREEQRDAIPRVNPPVRAEDGEDSRGRTHEERDRVAVQEPEDQGPEHGSPEKEEDPPRAPDAALEDGGDEDDPEDVQEEVAKGPVDEGVRDPRPRIRPAAREIEEPEIQVDGREDAEPVDREERDRVRQGEKRLARERVCGREDDDRDCR